MTNEAFKHPGRLLVSSHGHAQTGFATHPEGKENRALWRDAKNTSTLIDTFSAGNRVLVEGEELLKTWYS